jgi:xanthine/CO dehydrogenase XdhC/CoxF family maturation factor
VKDILAQVLRWRDQALKVNMAKVVADEASRPRQVGATIADNEQAEVPGSV